MQLWTRPGDAPHQPRRSDVMTDLVQKTDKGTKALAVLSIGQFLGGVLAVALGVFYDHLERSPGMLVIVGLGILAGPAFWGAFKLAHGGSK